jgi:nitrite reductase (NO-forming)
VTLPPPVGAIEVTVPANQLKFNPDKFQVPLDPASAITAIQITYHDAGAGQHTFDFDDPTVIWKTLEINNAGEKLTETAGFPKAGDYTFYCAIPGHRAAGMQGTITVTNSVKPQKVKAAPTTTSGA